MAEDTKTGAPAPQPQPSAAVTVTAPAPEEKPAAAATEVVEAEETPAAVAEKTTDDDSQKEAEAKAKEEKKMTGFASFKEESNVVGELSDAHKKALDMLKELVQDALKKHEFYAVEAKAAETAEQVKKDQHATAGAPAPEAKTEEAKESEKVVEEVKKDQHATAPAPEAKTEETKVEEVKKDDPAEPAAEANKGKEKVEEVKKDDPAAPAAEANKGKEKVEEEPKEAPAAAKTVEPVKESVVEAPAPEPEILPPEEVSIWGVPLLLDERSDTILLKFLRARDFRVKDAFTMLKDTVKWRKEFGVDELLEEDLGNDWDKVMFVHGTDKEGHPVCYNVYGEFMDKELYQKTFSDEEKRNKFIKWVIQSLEKSVRKLDFSPTGTSSIVQVNDLSNSPGLLKRELRQTTDKALQLLQDNYPEFVAKQVFVNVPWWYLAFYTVISPFLTQRSKSKFVISSQAKAADTLFNYIAPEQVPLQYGGLTTQGKQEFSAADSVSEVTIKASSKQTVEFPVSEKSHFVWQLRVIGWDVFYGAEFVPDAEDGYTVIVQKSRKIGAPDEPVIFNGYKVGEPGKIIVTINNTSSKKKKLLYRSKSIPLSG